jgi:hypothetical protein
MNDETNKIVQRFRPVIRIHEKEMYYPCSIDYILENGQLYENKHYVTDKIEKKKLIGLGESAEIRISPDAMIRQECKLSDIPVYAKVRSKKGKVMSITYIFLYTFNGPTIIPCSLINCFGPFSIGFHEGDVEHITVELNEKGNMKRIYYAAHGHGQGMWIDPHLIDKIGGRPVVYSAANSHASYPQPKTYWRIFGTANDYTSNDGQTWNPKEAIILDEFSWAKFGGKIGDVSSPSKQGWWFRENGKTISFWRRLFGCF